MKKILIVLDSCRFDTYLLANTKLFDEHIGKPIKSYTACNHTLPSFVCFMAYNRMPHPVDLPNNPKYNKEFNYIKEVKVPRYFLSDNIHLHPLNMPVKGIIDQFKKFKVFEPYYESCSKIINAANKLPLDKNYYLILWFGETHQPFNFNGTKTKNWKSIKSRIERYNLGKDTISKKEMDYLHRRQIDALEYLVKVIWHNFLKKHKDADIIITSDHGESFGENHRFGHGCDVHPAQFTVPFVCNR